MLANKISNTFDFYQRFHVLHGNNHFSQIKLRVSSKINMIQNLFYLHVQLRQKAHITLIRKTQEYKMLKHNTAQGSNNWYMSQYYKRNKHCIRAQVTSSYLVLDYHYTKALQVVER